MATEIKDIQKLISERAEERLNKQLTDLRTYLHSGFAQNLLELGDDVKISVEGQSDTIMSALWNTSKPIFKKLKEKLLPKYIEDETRGFLKKVDSVRTDVDNLLTYQGMQSAQQEDDLPY